MREVKKRPARDQVSALTRILADYDARLPAEVSRAASELHRKGAEADRAVERALTLALADSSIRQLESSGRLYGQRGGYPMGLAGLGASASDIMARMTQGIACSSAARDTATTMVGRERGSEAADWTRLGFEVVGGAAQCPPGVEVPLEPIPEPRERSSVMPIVMGAGVLAAVAGVAWVVTRKKPGR
jgi:hypothetical protein